MALQTRMQLSYGEVFPDSQSGRDPRIHKFELGISKGLIQYLTHRIQDDMFERATIDDTYDFSGRVSSRRSNFSRARSQSRIDKPSFMLDLVVVANEMAKDIDDLVALGLLREDQSRAIRLVLEQVTSGEFGPVIDSSGKIVGRSRDGFPTDSSMKPIPNGHDLQRSNPVVAPMHLRD